ncbi:MAG: enoyl-CoA hydratase/isomerase family protein [Ornithinimicrobium sp.]|uniref:enoyl-CoA hydratase/isomerase family protein n=1 Tax=Ornithinimicrobium sp. TaxID=1977084 RepID=UPI0026DF820A|nr:enoyl-CoA hydratase/isomerase family protein [Ornithinimicrobium sp.]MDO5739284.1 enoyl-CoA hydratase/isomerase family protein [Ornithinimicrobium sp.]
MSKSELSWAPAAGHDVEVLYAVDGPLGRIRLNRPRAINALDRASIDSLSAQLHTWADDDAIAAVVIDGAGDRGLCAGGDVRALREAVQAGNYEEALAYWSAEYAVNALIASYPTPFVAWMDGFVLGGGVGVSAHGSHRFVTERTQLAMPETIIGFFPDVGAMWFLANAPGETGTHVALTGVPVSGTDALDLGMADALVAAEAKEDVLAALRDDPTLDPANLDQRDQLPAEHWLLENREWIDRCYAGDDAGLILQRLRASGQPQARAAAEHIEARSPHSVAVTLAALRRAASMDVQEVLDQDLALAPAFARHPDFVEGVRAQLVDKDRQPRWAAQSVEQVSRAEVLAAFGQG